MKESVNHVYGHVVQVTDADVVIECLVETDESYQSRRFNRSVFDEEGISYPCYIRITITHKPLEISFKFDVVDAHDMPALWWELEKRMDDTLESLMDSDIFKPIVIDRLTNAE